MSYAMLKPPAPLSDLIETIWDWNAPAQAHRLERILPVANAGLIINLAEDQTRIYEDAPGFPCTTFSGAALDAPRHRSFVIDTAEQVAVMGVVFRSGGAAAFFRERMDVLVNGHVDLEDLVGSHARTMRERLLETVDSRARIALLTRWLAKMSRNAVRSAPIAHAAAWLANVPAVSRIGDACRDLGMSPRRFGTLFREHVGMSPKRYARLLRFRAVVDGVQSGRSIEWSRVAADCGFYDQPHLVREFRDFAGMTPTAYVARRGDYVNHVPLDDT